MGLFNLGKDNGAVNQQEENAGGSSHSQTTIDPLREKLGSFESGVDPEEAEKFDAGAEEKERRDREAKANFLTNMFMGAVGFLSREAAELRGEHCRLTDGEVKKLDEAVYPVSLKYVEKIGIPAWIDNYKEELTLGYVVTVIFLSKYRADRKVQAARRAAEEAAAGEGGEVGETGL